MQVGAEEFCNEVAGRSSQYGCSRSGYGQMMEMPYMSSRGEMKISLREMIWRLGLAGNGEVCLFRCGSRFRVGGA